MEAGGTYRFGEFLANTDQRSLTRRGAPVPLQPRTFDLLAYFLTHPGTLHAKQALLDEVWGEVVVTEGSLTRSIRQLRIALDDTADASRYVAR
jgi:DNA-binding winged helix-turn-helix (wHTH) protein